MARFASHEAYPFWRTMKEGYDYFELTRKLPTVAVCSRRYVVNVALIAATLRGSIRKAPARRSSSPSPIPFKPKPGEQFAEQRIVVPGQKMRSLASVDDGATRSGLLSTGSTGSLGRPAAQHELRAGQ